MTIDDLKKVLEGSDLSAVLPDLSKIVDSLAPIMKIALMAGPIILLALIYLVMVVALTRLLAIMERRLRKSDGK